MLNYIDTLVPISYILPITTHKVGESGGTAECSTGNMNTRSTTRAASSSPPNSGRCSKKIMWNDFLSLGVWIHVSSSSRKTSGRSRKPNPD